MSKKIILVIDDERDLVDLLAMRLEIDGFTIMKAFNGKEALSKLKEKKPDIILLDIMMPEMNGYEVCQEIKNDSQYKNIPVIILTAKVRKEDQERGRQVGSDDFIAKPYEYSELIEKIQKFIKD